MLPTIVKLDRSSVADLKRPFKTRLYKNSSAAGAIELAYERGRQAGAEDECERCAKIAERYERKCGSVNGRAAALEISSAIRRKE
mgnify:CR=1 FL=1